MSNYLNFVLFLICLLLENINNLCVKEASLNISIFTLLFCRNFFSLIGMSSVIVFFKPNNFNLKTILQIINSSILVFSIKNNNLILWIISLYFLFLYSFNNLILRSLVTFLAFYIDIVSIKKLDLMSISSAYYSIPVFSSLLSFFIFTEKISKWSLFQILIVAFFIFKNLKFTSLLILLGCFCFSVSDVLIRNSKTNIEYDIFLMSLSLSLYSSMFMENSTIEILSLMLNPYLLCLISGNILLQFILYNLFQKNSLTKLIPFRILGIFIGSLFDKYKNF